MYRRVRLKDWPDRVPLCAPLDTSAILVEGDGKYCRQKRLSRNRHAVSGRVHPLHIVRTAI